MENTHSGFTESMMPDMHDRHQLVFNSVASQLPKPHGDDDNADEEDDVSDSTADSEPAIDKEIVHSPLPTDNGGKPKS